MGFVPFVEIVVRAQVVEKGDFHFAAQQIRHLGCEAPVRNPVSTVCDLVQRPTKSDGERLTL